MKNILIVVDMQNDFVSGALGSTEAAAIVSGVEDAVRKAAKAGHTIIFTRDTHDESYLESQEGKNLPVPHCIRNTPGWEIIDELKPYSHNRLIIDKPGFGSRELGEVLAGMNEGGKIESITLLGLCTDICVISNAMLIKAYLPEVPIRILADCCAGVSPASHENALNAMAVCQIEIIR